MCLESEEKTGATECWINDTPHSIHCILYNSILYIVCLPKITINKVYFLIAIHLHLSYIWTISPPRSALICLCKQLHVRCFRIHSDVWVWRRWEPLDWSNLPPVILSWLVEPVKKQKLWWEFWRVHRDDETTISERGGERLQTQ